MDNTALFFLIFNLSHRYPWLDQLMIFGAVYLIYLCALIIFILGITGKPQEQKAAGLAILSYLIALGLMEIIHLLYFEPRPFITFHLKPLIDQVPNFSFPSGHATNMAIMAFSFAFYRSKWAWLFLVAMLWVGFARIYTGVHYPLDILGGILTGFTAVAIGWQIKRWLRKSFF
jgi:undecaprenyl-diphosphatase